MKRHYYKGLLPLIIIFFTLALAACLGIQAASPVDDLTVQDSSTSLSWTHLSTANGDLDPPSDSTQQTASLVLDINKDGLNDLVVGVRRSPGPSMVWYKRQASGWQRFVIDSQVLKIEAGGATYDIDQDGDMDIVMGGDNGSNQVWWWENPYPNYNPTTNWTRRLIKNSGGNKHHDQMFGDFDNDGKTDLVFWNQGSKKLILAEIPANPLTSGSWTQQTIYSWSSGPEHEGLSQADIDLDGLVDIAGGGRWFKYNGDGTFTANIIDSAQTFSRTAAGQLKKGGRPEVVFVIGDGGGRLKWYEWVGSQWQGTDLLGFNVDHGHSLQIEDVNGDGNLDIFVAEMRLNSGNSNAKMWIFLGDGNGNFTTTEVATGYGNHESKLGDLDGDGDVDILGKPFNWETPRLDIWLNDSSDPAPDQWERHLIDPAKPQRSIFIFPADLDYDGLQDVVTGGWWYKNPGTPSGNWTRRSIGAPLNNVAAIYDFDGDGFLDILGTEGVGSASNDNFVWARNDGSGNFTIRNNIDTADGDFLQGVAADEFVSGNAEVALSWHRADRGIQILDVPSDPLNDKWPWRQISPTSQDEALSSGDIDRDGDRDLLLGTKWLRNDSAAGSSSGWVEPALNGATKPLTNPLGTNEQQAEAPSSGPWSVHDLFQGSGNPDRNRLADINGDGRLDAVVGYEAINVQGKLAWYEQPETATNLWTEHIIADDVIGPMSLDVGDIDGDTDLDVVVGEHYLSNEAAARVLFYENPGNNNGPWIPHLISTGDEHHDGTQLVDIDNDGDLDVLSIGWGHNRVLLYENQSEVNGEPVPVAVTYAPIILSK